MQRHPKEFDSAEIVYPAPIAMVEYKAHGTDASKPIHLIAPGKENIPLETFNRKFVHFYAGGDSLHKLLERVRTELTTMLFRHLRLKS
jgi:hypothetical protein